ncbi:MAG: tRNA (adenosine(37)-N6)-dimethylallyltransferase MiaA [Epsilonproteobacteria bacterium]|nr:tRNA (adenosine(37)-N6)-dimethylallyltransferase MiaA [Campylobacterota bacterium]
MPKEFKQIAIIGPTASGKSDLAISIAQKIDAYILSIDSLSIYKEIDIISAKPSKENLAQVKHFGINEIYPNEHFSVEIFIRLYHEVKAACEKAGKNLIIVGGTSFYLASLLNGLSKLPEILPEHEKGVFERLMDVSAAHAFLESIDPEYAQNIAQNDRYRLEKALLIYEASGLSPSKWFAANPPQPVITELPIFNIDVERAILRERIAKRTKKMIELGAIDEVCYLEKTYGRAPNSMKSIGIVEILEYLDGKVKFEEMIELISTHTAQLAKRQQTFNRTQFKEVVSAPLESLEEIILKDFGM